MIDWKGLAFVAAGFWLCAGASAAQAELYRCTDAAGKVTFTGDAHSCRGQAERHETRRKIQNSGPTPAAPLSPRVGRRRSAPPANPHSGAAAMWKRKKGEAQQQLREIETNLPRWVRLQTNCNRGADTWYTDEAGIKHTVSCSDIAARRKQVETDRARLRAYLNGGLEDECRRAGCLPGWIR